jgi:hypothetical protein
MSPGYRIPSNLLKIFLFMAGRGPKRKLPEWRKTKRTIHWPEISISSLPKTTPSSTNNAKPRQAPKLGSLNRTRNRKPCSQICEGTSRRPQPEGSVVQVGWRHPQVNERPTTAATIEQQIANGKIPTVYVNEMDVILPGTDWDLRQGRSSRIAGSTTVLAGRFSSRSSVRSTN